MAILSNINDKFRVDSAGAVYFGTSAGTNGLILKSIGTGGSPVWVDPNTVGTGPWLPLAGGDVTGNLTVGGTLGVTGDATFTAVETASITLPSKTLTIGTRLDGNTVVIRGFYGDGGGKLSFVSGYASVSTYNWTTGEVFATDDGNFDGRLEFRTGDSTRTGPTTKMTIRNTGAVAFGTSITNYGTSGQVLTSAGNTTPTWTTPTTGTVTGAGSLNFLPKYLSNGTDIGNSILQDLNGQLNTSTAQSVLGKFKGTTSSGYAEFQLLNDVGNYLVMGSIGSAYTSADFTNSTYLYNNGSGRNFWVKSSNDLGFFSGGMTIASHKRMTILSAGNIQMTTKLVIGATTPQNYRLQLGLNGSLVDSIAIGNYAVAKNTRQYIGYTRADTGLFEDTGDGDTISTVMAGVAGVRIVNTAGTLASAQADNSVQLLTHIYNGGSRVALHARYDGNIGIGTTSPDYKLHVSDTSIDTLLKVENSSVNKYPHISLKASAKEYHIGVGGASAVAGYANNLYFYDNTTAAIRMLIDTNGNVGIGTDSPVSKLQVGDHMAGNTITIGGFYAAGGGVLAFKSGYAPNLAYVWNTAEILATDDGNFNGRIEFKTSTATRAAPTIKMVLKANGNVGIGTTSPGSKLEVKTSGTNSVIELDNSDTHYTLIQHNALGVTKGFSGYNSGFMLFGGESNVSTRFQSGGSYAATILTNGNFGIGTTSPTNAKLVVAGKVMINNVTAPNNLAQLNIGYSGGGETRAIDIDGGWNGGENKSISFTYSAGATNLVGQINCKHDSPGSRISWGKLYHSGDSTTYTMELISSSQTTANLTVAGNITAAADVVAYSDERLKTNIKTLDGSKVLKMRGVSFEKEGKKGSGVIAQELEKIAPELVNNDNKYKGVAYGNLVGYLIEAIKELEARVKILENK